MFVRQFDFIGQVLTLPLFQNECHATLFLPLDFLQEQRFMLVNLFMSKLFIMPYPCLTQLDAILFNLSRTKLKLQLL